MWARNYANVLIDFDFEIELRARKVTGTFKKQAPGELSVKNELSSIMEALIH